MVGSLPRESPVPHTAFGRTMVSMFERFTDRARRVVVLAQEEARLLNHNYIGTEHVLLGLIREAEGVAAQTLEALGVSLEAVRTRIEEIIGTGGGSVEAGHVPFTPRAKKVLELSLREAIQLGHNYIGTEHLLLGLIREGEGVAAQVLVQMGAELHQVRREVVARVSGSGTEEEEAAPDPEAKEALIQSLSSECRRLRDEVDMLREVLRRLGEEPDPPVA
jgi:ATP-dependent Clp protease ATP-binding subunit ClpC